MSCSNREIVLDSLVKSTFALLLDDANTDENREHLDLVEKLEERIELLRARRNGINNELLTSLKHLKSAVVFLRICFEDLEEWAGSSAENSTSQNELPHDESARLETDDYSGTETEHSHFPNDSQSRQLYTPKHTQLQEEVLQIQSTNAFLEAKKLFIDSKKISAKVFEKESERETKITATKIRIVSEILGNLTNLRDATMKCTEYISELHGIFNLQSGSPFPTWYKALSYIKLEKIFKSQAMKLDSAMHINAVVFRFIKEFIRKPVAMLDWTTINIGREELRYQKTHHPILGEQPPKGNKPDPFTAIEEEDIDSQVSVVNCSGEVVIATKNSSIEMEEEIDSQVSAVNCSEEVVIATENPPMEMEAEIDSQVSADNCSGEVVIATENPSIEILRITPSGNKRYGVDGKRKRKILSISIDCVDCQTPDENATEPTANEASAEASIQSSEASGQSSEAPAESSNASAQSSEASFSLPHTPCKGKMYILTADESNRPGRVKYFLYVTDMDGNMQHKEEELGFLESPQLVQAKIFCISEKKLIILDVTGHVIYICDNKGKHLKSIDMTAQFSNAYFSRSTIFTISYNGEFVCSEGRNKLNIYNIDEEGSSLQKIHEIKLKHVVQAVAFNHVLDEMILLCHTSVLLQYYLVIYTKAGKLKQEIKLQNGNYRKANLIFHRNGAVVLLGNQQLLHLK